jgi:hypothetical protein
VRAPRPVHRRLLGLAAVSLTLVLTAAPHVSAQADRRVEVYRPAHRPADELLPLAETALAGEGSAAVDPGTNAIVLIGAPGAVARTLELLRGQDVARRAVLVRFESRRRDELTAAGVTIDWSLGAGDLRVGNVVVPKGVEGVRVFSSAGARSDDGGFRGVLRVLDGDVGRIGSGRSVPVRTFESLAFVEAERGFRVRPRVLGDGRVRVEIEPSDAEVDAGGRTAFTAAATTVTLRPGETVAIGEVARRSEGHEVGTRVIGTERDREERLLLLTVELPDD